MGLKAQHHGECAHTHTHTHTHTLKERIRTLVVGDYPIRVQFDLDNFRKCKNLTFDILSIHILLMNEDVGSDHCT